MLDIRNERLEDEPFDVYKRRQKEVHAMEKRTKYALPLRWDSAFGTYTRGKPLITPGSRTNYIGGAIRTEELSLSSMFANRFKKGKK